MLTYEKMNTDYGEFTMYDTGMIMDSVVILVTNLQAGQSLVQILVEPR
jgi:hypothetical protein